MGAWRFRPPADLRAWELELDGDVFVLFEWDASAPDEPPTVSEAERDVLRGILRGESNAAIAKRRRTNTRTVANQVAAIFRKLGVRSRAELVASLVRRDARD